MTPVASRTLLASLLLTAAGATAIAQPAETPPSAPPPCEAPCDDAPPPAPPAPPAPQTHDWAQVSNINGQLVPVGEKNSYLYEFKRTIISTDPLGWIIGMYGISGSYAIDDHIAIRGELDYISPPSDSGGATETIVEADVGLPIYFRRTYQGAFLEPGLVMRHTETTSPVYNSSSGGYTSGTTTDSTDAFGPQVLVGWHWTWESGLNIAVAAGVGRNLNYKQTYDQYGYASNSGDPYIANGYLRFGYAF
jgi:hypothetical protein